MVIWNSNLRKLTQWWYFGNWKMTPNELITQEKWHYKGWYVGQRGPLSTPCSAMCQREAQKERGKGWSHVWGFRHEQKWGLAQKRVHGGWGWDVLVESGWADDEMPCWGMSDQFWRKAGVGNFPGQTGMLRKGGNVDLEKRICVPETKQKDPFSIVLLVPYSW